MDRPAPRRRRRGGQGANTQKLPLGSTDDCVKPQDWDGLTGHEENWAERMVGLGYVGSVPRTAQDVSTNRNEKNQH